MANSTLAGLTASSGVADTDLFYADTGAADVKVTAAQLKTYTTSSIASLQIAGSSSGTITVNGAAAAGTWTLTLPTSAGTSGYPLLSGAGSTCTWGIVGTAAGGTALSTFTAKGAILAATSASALLAVQVGTDGQVLTADAASSAGVKWATAAGGGGITIGTTTSNGTAGRILYTDGTNVQAYSVSGTGTTVPLTAGPTFTGTLTAGSITIGATGAIAASGAANLSFGTNSYIALGTTATSSVNLNGYASGVTCGSGGQFGIHSSGISNSNPDVLLNRQAAGIWGVRGTGATNPASFDLYTYGASPPAAGAASIARIYVDTSGGKDRVMAIFSSGAAQVMATQP